MPLEPYQLISQYTLEPLLKSVAETLPSVTMRYGCAFLSLEQDGEGVTATVRNRDGSTARLRSAYLVGCDGGASPVRKELGIKLRGKGTSCSSVRRSFTARTCSTKSRSARARPRPPLPCRRRAGDLSHHAGFDRALDSARSSSGTRTWRRSSSEPSACRSATRCCMWARGSRTFCSPTVTDRAACSWRATPRISSSRPAASA